MPRYPEELLDWAGNRAGGVKKLFYSGSGRPAGAVIKTRLLGRLHRWAEAIGRGDEGTPRAVLLVGGPGNGKTEAVEFTIGKLDEAMGLGGGLVRELATCFAASESRPTPRMAVAQNVPFPGRSRVSDVAIVQDASEGEHGTATTPASLFVADVRSLLQGHEGRIYLACVNRGVLDDALILASESGDAGTGAFLRQVIQSVALSADAPRCWPLNGFPSFAVWPMDVETLAEDTDQEESPAKQVLAIATAEANWTAFGVCAAGERCPFCTSRAMLQGEPHASSLVRILRWYELASGKRWNFRDLFSLVAFLLAGTSDGIGATSHKPCQWAASLLSPTGSDPLKVEILKKRALFKLVGAQYQHALFGTWPIERARSLRADLVDLNLMSVPVLAALQQFLAHDKRRESTSTLRTQLSGLAEHLDPAFANPNLEVAVSANTKITFNDLDRRFSRSIKEGRRFLQKYQCLSLIEVELFKAMEDADEKLSDASVRRQKPATAERVQALLRLIACRIARRSVGVRSGVTRDTQTLMDFHRVSHGDLPTLQEATQQVEMLLNRDRRFVVCLNTTFGEPLPPPERRAMLMTDVQRVRSLNQDEGEGRPLSPVRFLKVGSSDRAQPVALTYELFRATKALRKGMIPASLPRSVVALLDTTRARLAGSIVRNEDALENCEIRVGIRDDVIVRTFGRFVVRREES